MELKILFEDPHMILIDKPAGLHVHKPEDPRIRGRFARHCMELLKRQRTGEYYYPVHRLDFSTSGLVVFGLSQEAARRLSQDFRERKVQKSYLCMVRGFTEESFAVNRPLASERDSEIKLEAETKFRRIAQIEIPHAVGPYASARYSLLWARPTTGRLHQIRRHLSGISHPIVGDVRHGDHRHNHFARTQLGLDSLLLRAYALSFEHPITFESLCIRAGLNESWQRVFGLFSMSEESLLA
jgi:tRNA pseudouridine65 synthase